MIPASRGGNGDIENLLASCKTCNIRKNDKTPFEFKVWIADSISHDVYHLKETLAWASGSGFWAKEKLADYCYIIGAFERDFVNVSIIEPFFYYERAGSEQN